VIQVLRQYIYHCIRAVLTSKSKVIIQLSAMICVHILSCAVLISVHRQCVSVDSVWFKLEKYVGPVPSYYAAVRLAITPHWATVTVTRTFWTENLHTGYSWGRLYQFWIFYAVCSWVMSLYETDRRTDGQARPVIQNIWTAA